MYEGATVVVVVVAYNEEGLVGEVIETVPEFVDRVYVVDDASTDGTWGEIRAHAEQVNERAAPAAADGGQRVVPIRHEENQGVGGAVKTGFRRALADDFDVLVTVAGDGQMDPDQMPRLVEPVARGEVGLAKGNRLHDPATRQEMSAFRYVGNVVLTGLNRIASGYWGMTDPQNGYTAISRDALAAIDVASLYEDYGNLNDMWVRLNVAGVRYVDVSMPAVYGEETSDIDYRSFIPTLSGLLLHRFYWRLWRKYVVDELHPLVGLHALGTAAVVGSACRGVGAAVDALAASGDDESDGRDDGGCGLALGALGVAAILLGMVFDRIDNESLEARERR